MSSEIKANYVFEMFLVVKDVVFTSSINLGALTLAAMKYIKRKKLIHNRNTTLYRKGIKS